jgi:valyl-tRNA synthetase
MLAQYAAYLKQLAGLETLEFRRDAAPPADTVTRVLDHAHIYVPLAGIADRKDEIEKLQKELAGIDSEGAGLAQKLGKAGFVERAPAAVVDEARAREAQLAERRQKLQAMLAELGP